MRCKICGITNLKDALAACKAGADALGFVFYKDSPRYIEPKSAKAIIAKLPPFVKTVGLFVNADAADIDAICKEASVDIAQIHFEPEKDFFDQLQIPYLKVIRATSKEDVLEHEGEYVLVDAFVQNYGGEGKRVALEWFDGVDCSHIILAGGLTSKNLGELKGYGFYGVDVSSGVEKSKGVKDHRKIEAFIVNAKSL